jgi:hypothetical protein
MLYTYPEKFLRDVRNLKIKIDRAVASAVADTVLDEFEILVNRTAQWSGRTAASWNIGYGSGASVRRPPESGYLRGVEPSAEAGDQTAVYDALGRAQVSVKEYKSRGYRTGDLVVYNNTGTAFRTTLGANPPGAAPLRSENAESLGAFEDFEERVALANIIITEDLVL